MKTVRIFGGGVAGLTVAHELACRDGFEVIVHEPRDACGGKARSQFHDGLPGEHGFRFFPGWYLHVTDIMRRIPLDAGMTSRDGAQTGYSEAQSVAARLREVQTTLTFRAGKAPISYLGIPKGVGEFGEFIKGFSWIVDGVDAADRARTLSRISLKLFLFYSTPPWLRADRFDGMSLADFLGAASLPKPVQEALRTVPKALVAMDASHGSAHTFLNTSLLNLSPAWNSALPDDRVLRGPTSRTWIDPWVASLKALGVQFVHGADGTAERVLVEQGKVSAVQTAAGGRVLADAYVLAMPIGPLQAIVRASSLAAEASELDTVSRIDLQKQTSEMVGIQLYLNQPLHTLPGHLFFEDSQYGLTAISQLEIWDREFVDPLAARGLPGLLSLDVTEWRADPLDRHPPPFPLPSTCRTSDELAALVVKQLADYRLADGSVLLPAGSVVSHHLDEDIDLGTETNRSALLIHPPGTWARRPLPESSISGLFLASDFVKNPADLATMEGACSAGKLAVNAILRAQAPDAPPVPVHELVQELEPHWLRAQQHGFEALVNVLGSFERAERAVELLLAAEDDALDVLTLLHRAPSELARWVHIDGAVVPPGASLLARLRRLAVGLLGRVSHRLQRLLLGSAEADLERMSRRVQHASRALQRWQ